MDSEDYLDWQDSAAKHYGCFRTLLFLGYTKQAMQLLCLSVEKFLKLYVSLKYKLNEEQIKTKYGHGLKKLFADTLLDKTEYNFIHQTCEKFEYNSLRYDFEGIGNGANFVLPEIETEIKKLSRETILLFNNKYKARVIVDRWPNIRQDRKYKKYFLERALRGKNTSLSMDFT